MKAPEQEKRDRRDWIVIFIILLFGFLCILIAGGWALRLSPNWSLNTSMESYLDLNSNFVKPDGFFNPPDSSILTQPAWMGVFLTPGATFNTRTPAPTSVINTRVPPSTPTPRPRVTLSPTNTSAIPSPTKTKIYVPPTSTLPPLTATAQPQADVRIVKDDGVATYGAYNTNNSVTYTIVVSNSGPGNITGAVVSDMKPSQVTTWSWACTSQTNGANGCTPMLGNANFTDTVNLPNGGSITYTVTTNIAIGSTGNLVNTATISLPSGYGDPNPGNNISTDTDTLFVPSVDLQVTKTDGIANYISNSQTVYTVTVANNGPDAVTGALLIDSIPAQISNWSWACAAQTGGASGCTPATNISADFSDTINLPNGASISYTVTADISATATGPLDNTAMVSVPAGYNDPDNTNNSATDTDAYAPSADLVITKDDGVITYVVGGSVTYTITVSNPSGPDNVIGATVTDNFPIQVASATWTCTGTNGGTCAASGVGNNINDTVDLPVTASVTYIVTANISSAATGNLTNTATVTSSITDPVLGNNTAMDITDTPVFNVDLGITKTDGVGVTTYTPGSPITYNIVVSNAGPADATGASVADIVPASITGTTINCVASGTASCGTNASAGNSLSYTGANIPVGAGNFLTITVNGTVNSATTGNLINTASVTAPGGYTETVPGNNSATDTDTQNSIINLGITNTDNSTDYAPNGTKTYTIVVSNTGPSNVIGATVTDMFGSNANITSWTCSATGTASCTAVGGAGNLNDIVNIPVGQTLTYTVTATVVAAPAGNLVNTATVTAPGGYTGTTNATAMDTDMLIVSSGTTTGNLGTTPDGTVQNLTAGQVILTLSSPVSWGHPGNDITYYEEAQAPGILMDQVLLEISDGSNWYPILNWGDGNPNPGTNIVSPPGCATEVDDCPIDSTVVPLVDYLGNGIFTGITIDIDAILTGIPPGTQFQYIRITTPPGGDGTTGIDAIYVWP